MSGRPGGTPDVPRYFRNSAQLRGWLEKHHATGKELWVGLYKKGTGIPSITWPELVDELLCFGWIDGVRKSVDAEGYTIRVTPRKPGSTWSAINLKRVEQLRRAGRMAPAGNAVYDARDREKEEKSSFEQQEVALPAEYESEFRRNGKAWDWFSKQPPGYRKTATWWVISAKQEATRRRRLATLIDDAAHELRIALLRR